MKMTQSIVTHRTSRKQQIMNGDEFQRFFRPWYDKQTKKIKYMNKLNDYAYSAIKSKEEKVDEFITYLVVPVLAVTAVVLITKLIMLCL